MVREERHGGHSQNGSKNDRHRISVEDTCKAYTNEFSGHWLLVARPCACEFASKRVLNTAWLQKLHAKNSAYLHLLAAGLVLLLGIFHTWGILAPARTLSTTREEGGVDTTHELELPSMFVTLVTLIVPWTFILLMLNYANLAVCVAQLQSFESGFVLANFIAAGLTRSTSAFSLYWDDNSGLWPMQIALYDFSFLPLGVMVGCMDSVSMARKWKVIMFFLLSIYTIWGYISTYWSSAYFSDTGTCGMNIECKEYRLYYRVALLNVSIFVIRALWCYAATGEFAFIRPRYRIAEHNATKQDMVHLQRYASKLLPNMPVSPHHSHSPGHHHGARSHHSDSISHSHHIGGRDSARSADDDWFSDSSSSCSLHFRPDAPGGCGSASVESAVMKFDVGDMNGGPDYSDEPLANGATKGTGPPGNGGLVPAQHAVPAQHDGPETGTPRADPNGLTRMASDMSYSTNGASPNPLQDRNVLLEVIANLRVALDEAHAVFSSRPSTVGTPATPPSKSPSPPSKTGTSDAPKLDPDEQKEVAVLRTALEDAHGALNATSGYTGTKSLTSKHQAAMRKGPNGYKNVIIEVAALRAALKDERDRRKKTLAEARERNKYQEAIAASLWEMQVRPEKPSDNASSSSKNPSVVYGAPCLPVDQT